MNNSLRVGDFVVVEFAGLPGHNGLITSAHEKSVTVQSRNVYGDLEPNTYRKTAHSHYRSAFGRRVSIRKTSLEAIVSAAVLEAQPLTLAEAVL